MLFTNLVAKLLYRWPLDKGHVRLFNFLSDGAKQELDTLPQPIRMKSGIQLFVRPNDELSRRFRCFGVYEPHTSRMLRQYANPGEVFIDIGANLGLHSLGVAKDIGCHVAAFEPHPDTANCLDRSIEVNGLSATVTCFRVALSNEDGLATLVQPLTHAGISALQGPNPHFREGERFEVRVAQLDSLPEFQTYLAALDKRVGLIKIDIEGAEERALRGMIGLLKEHRPAIIMELYDGNLFGFVSSKAAVISLLESVGYKLVEEFEWNGLFVHQEKLGKN
jgi:FkbM family methyltransferase